MIHARVPTKWLHDVRLSLLTDAAFRLHTHALLWTVHNLTDGVINRDDIWSFEPCSMTYPLRVVVEELVESELWSRRGEDWILTDYSSEQVSKAAMKALASARAVQQQLEGPNKLEQAGYAILDGLGVDYQPQVPFRDRFVPDATVSSACLVIQFDGDYWHGKKGISHPNIRKRVALDRSQDAYVRACGWEVLRFWESDVYQDPIGCSRKIMEMINRLGDVFPDAMPCDCGGPGPSRIRGSYRVCARCSE